MCLMVNFTASNIAIQGHQQLNHVSKKYIENKI